MTDANRILGLHHTGLSVQDLPKAVQHYEEQLGFTCAARYALTDLPTDRTGQALDEAPARAALMRCPTGYMELVEFRERSARPKKPAVFEAGIRHACIQAIDVEPLFDACIAAGGSAHARPSGLGTGALYAYIRDPEDNIIELEGVPWGPEDMRDPWYAHTAIVTPDIQKLTGFYETVIGVEVHDRGTFGPHKAFDKVAGVDGVEFEGAWIKLPNATLEFWEYSAPRTEPATDFDFRALGWNHICFEVRDIEAEYARLQAAGVQLPGSIASNEMADFFYGLDPDGNVFECISFQEKESALSVSQLTGWGFLAELEQKIAAHYHRSS